MIKYENDYAIIDGYKFKKDKKTGYYLSGTKINGKRERLHRYIYETYKEKIPKGYDIHHIDHNKDNNEIENLQLVTRKEHNRIHAKEMTEELKQKYRDNLNKNARPKAIEWHKSEEGKAWHREQYKISLMNYKRIQKERTLTCLNCGKEYKTITTSTTKFCSNNCKSAYRRKLGVDNVTRKCEKCGTEFITNKYSKRRYCDKCWRSR